MVVDFVVDVDVDVAVVVVVVYLEGNDFVVGFCCCCCCCCCCSRGNYVDLSRIVFVACFVLKI